MSSLHVINIRDVFSDLDRWINNAQEMVEGVACGLVTEALLDNLDQSPQYSGDFAANWIVEVGKVTPRFVGGLFDKAWSPNKDERPDEPFTTGSPEAIAYAVNANLGSMATFKLGETIWIHNSAEHLTTYAWKIESNQIKFRPNNEGEVIRRTMDNMRSKYTIISRADAYQLIQNKI